MQIQDVPAAEASDDGSRRRLRYEPALDGIRAIAVAGVLLFHDPVRIAGTWGRGGFLGVDIFFVLSGYLITSLLLFERKRNGRVNLGSFWVRRVRRLYPALAVAMALIAVYAVLATPIDRRFLKTDALFSLIYVQNWHTIWSGEPLSPLSHVWSLSVEEQWYLVWPLALGLLLRVRKHALAVSLSVLTAGTLVSAYLMSRYFSAFDTARSYNGTDTRAQELLIGAILAFLLTRVPEEVPARLRWIVEPAAWVGAAFVAYELMAARTTDVFLYRGGFLLLCVAVAAVISLVTLYDSPMRRLLSAKWLVGLGLISYGVYLYGNILFSLFDEQRVHLSGVRLFALRAAITLVFATLSYRLIERPIRDGSRARAAKPVDGAGVARRRLPLRAMGVGLVLVASLAVIIPLHASNGVAPALLNEPTVAYLAQARAATAPGARRVLLLGESTAYALSSGSRAAGPPSALTAATYSTYSCGLLPGTLVAGGVALGYAPYCSGWLDAYRTVVSTFQPNVIVLAVGDVEVYDRDAGTVRVAAGSAAWEADFDGALSAIETLAHQNGAKLMIATHACPGVSSGIPILDKVQDDPSRINAVNSALDRFAAARGLPIVDLASAMCPAGHPASQLAGTPLYSKTGFAPGGANAVWRFIWSRVQSSK
ncbi:MAG TPA: acyltransferase [Acidimicrobiia bacterium]